MIEISGITKVVNNGRMSDEEWKKRFPKGGTIPKILKPKKEKNKCKVIETHQRIQIPVIAVEFDQGGNTIWIQGKGGTTIRIKTMGKINVEQCKDSPVSHCDIIVQEDINFCISKDVK